MCRTSPDRKPSRSTWRSAVPSGSSRGRTVATNIRPSRSPGARRSSVPNPVSTSTRPAAVSTRRQWQTSRPAAKKPPVPLPLTSLAGNGHMVPQLR